MIGAFFVRRYDSIVLQVTDNQKYGMIEAISHLLQRDYNEIVEVRMCS